MSAAFKSCFPDVTYSSAIAKRKLLQLPLAAITIGTPSSGRSEVYLMEAIRGLDYRKLIQFLESKMSPGIVPTITKQQMNELLSFAQSDRERETLRYSVCKSSGLTSTAARRIYGWEKMSDRSSAVESALQEAQEIRESIEQLCLTQEHAVLKSLGINPDFSDDSSSDTVDDSDSDEETIQRTNTLTKYTLPAITELNKILTGSQYNWFELVSTVLMMTNCDDDKDEEEVVTELDGYFEDLKVSKEFTQEQYGLIQQSHDAFVYDKEQRLPFAKKQAAAMNGDIITDSDSDDGELYVGLTSARSEKAKVVIKKRVQTIRRKARYMKAKLFAERHFLARKQSRSVRGILKDHPDIGSVIEEFVKERNIGADAWRRTGVLTFDGNTKVKQKVTYNRIREYLQSVYKRKFSHGTVVQMCVARNRRRKSACRYKGVARVTCRRARKGFQLKYNPDSHWSNALYRGLNVLQYTDGRHLLLVNRDDAAGFRLDTMATHRLQKTPMVQGCQALTTYTDYVNRYPSLLQTTSYNFTGTQTTAEVCVGIVKASGLYQKNPAQHAADINFLQNQQELRPVFFSAETNLPKCMECIRVDGASDEGPNHEEVQFFLDLTSYEYSHYHYPCKCS